MKTIVYTLLLSLFITVAGCSDYGSYLKDDPADTNGEWTTGTSKSYSVSPNANSRIEDDISNSTFVFPEGGSGTLTVSKIKSGPNTTEATEAFQVEYTGTGKIQLQIPGKPGEDLLIGYSPFLGSGILVDESTKDLAGLWIPIPEKDGGNNTVIFDLPLSKNLFKTAGWAGISAYKKLNIRDIKDDELRFDTLIREATKNLIKAIPTSLQSTVMTAINGDMKLKLYVNTDVSQPCYQPFEFFGFGKRILINFKPVNGKGNAAHEFGHYMHHVLVGDYYANFARNPRGPDHAVGETGARDNIIEEPAYLSEYYLYGMVGTNEFTRYNPTFDPEQGNFCIEPRNSGGGKHVPWTQDFLDIEGFGIELMASVCRTKTSITNYKGETVTVPVMKPEMTDRTPMFQDMYSIIESGENSIPGIAENIVGFASAKWGGKEAVKNLQLMWQPLGYQYIGVLTFTGKDKKGIKGVTAQSFIKVGTQEYLLKKNTLESKDDGTYTISAIFPGTSSLRIYYTNDAGESKTQDFDDFFNISWDAATDQTIEKEVVIDDENLVPFLNNTLVAGVQFDAMFSTTRGDQYIKQLVDNNSSGTSLNWGGQGFSVDKKWNTTNGPYNRYEKHVSIAGNVSVNGHMLETCTAVYNERWYEVGESGSTLLRTIETTISCTGIPVATVSEDKKRIAYALAGSSVEGKATMTYSEIWTSGGNGIVTKSILWNDQSAPPGIVIAFIGK